MNHSPGRRKATRGATTIFKQIIMKVYVLTINEVSEFEQFDHDPEAFAKKEDARKMLAKARADAIGDYLEEDDDEDCSCAIDKDTDDYFALYSQTEGWSHTHYEASVTECEVQ